MVDQGWNPSEAELRRLKLLQYLADNDTGTTYVALPDWADEVRTDSYRKVVGDLEMFEARGWVSLAKDMDGGCDAILTGTGRSEIERLQEQRNNRTARYSAARDAVLHWLYEQYVTGTTTPNLQDFFGSPFSLYYGAPFENAEIDTASRFLKDEGLIEGQGAWGGGIVRPTLTSKGVRLAVSGRSVNDPEPSVGGTVHLTINQHGDYAVAQAAGHGAAQNFTQTAVEDHKQQILGFAGALEELIRAKDLGVISEMPGQLRQAAEGNDHGTIARVLNGTREYLEQHASTGLGALVLVELGNLMHTIGLT